MHALIIEDELLLASILHEVLQDLGYTSFHFAQTEVEALALFGQRRPDLITADVQLRLGSGVGAVMALSLQLLAMYWRPLGRVLGTGPVDRPTLIACLAGVMLIVLVTELTKLGVRRSYAHLRIGKDVAAA